MVADKLPETVMAGVPVSAAAITLLQHSAEAWFGLGPTGLPGPLQHYSGVAILLAADRRVLAANALGHALCPSLMAEDGRAGDEQLEMAMSAALAATPQASHLAGIELTAHPPGLPGEAGDPSPSRHCLDLDLLPCAGGVLILGRDISLERALRGALIESRQRLRDLVEIASDFTWETDALGRFSIVSPQGALGYSAVELIGRDPAEFLMVPEDVGCFRGERPSADVWMRDQAGRAVCHLVLALPIADAAGKNRGARGLARDVTADRLRMQELANARHRERLLVHVFRVLRQADNPSDALGVALHTAIQALGAVGGQLYRWQGEAPVLLLQHGDPLSTDALLQAAMTGASAQADIGGYHVMAMACRRRGKGNGCLILWREIDQPKWDADDLYMLDELTDQMALVIRQLGRHEELWQLSETDSLTGLLNRRGFMRALGAVMPDAGAEQRGGALAYIDLDNFKNLNDRQGHAAGDAALIATAVMLRHWCRSSDLLARLGGDEFVAWLPGIAIDQAQERAAALMAASKQTACFSPTAETPIGLSIGIAWLPPTRQASPDALLECADRAMYESKRQGKGRINLASFGAKLP